MKILSEKKKRNGITHDVSKNYTHAKSSSPEYQVFVHLRSLGILFGEKLDTPLAPMAC